MSKAYTTSPLTKFNPFMLINIDPHHAQQIIKVL